MGFQSTQQRYRAKPPPTPVVAPYYGMSTLVTATENMVLSLTGRGPTPGVIDTTFQLNALTSSGNYMYFAYPADYGTARFRDVDENFVGGWDGANDDPFNVFGPISLIVHVNSVAIPFYVYRTDYPDLGLCHWVASLDPAG